jgi:ABC-2 type transport system ATP-binding protein
MNAERRGDAVTLSCSDADAALRSLHSMFSGMRDIEVRGSSLEEAFLELTAEQRSEADREQNLTVEIAR